MIDRPRAMAPCSGTRVVVAAAAAALAVAASAAPHTLRGGGGASRPLPRTAAPPVVNMQPIVGILTLPNTADEACARLAAQLGRRDEDPGSSCVTAYYEPWLLATGARSVFIPYNANHSVLDALFASVNGILFTGGSTNLRLNETYLQTAAYLFDKVIAANNAGDYFPLHGTCMGFQSISIIAARNESVLDTLASGHGYDSEDVTWPLDFTPEARGSRLFGGAPAAVWDVFARENSTVNLHHDGVRPAVYNENPRMRDLLVMTSTNVDRRGKPFVSSWEGRGYPITATQFHPERPLADWRPNSGISHAPDVILANRYVGDFFVEDARRNAHVFDAALAPLYSTHAYHPTPIGPLMDGYEAYLIDFPQ